MTQRRGEHCPSALRLDRWLAGELTSVEGGQLAEHVGGCELCRQRHAELSQARASFAAAAPPFAELREAAQGRWRAGSLRRWRWRAAVPALAAVAALALTLGRPWQSGPAAPAGVRTKGERARLGWVVRRGEQTFVGSADQALRAGDAVRFTVSAREAVYVALLGLDAAGHLSVYHPEGDRLERVEAGNQRPLPAAIELDGAPGQERIYGVFCDGPAPIASVAAAIESAPEAPALPAECSLVRSTLRTEAP